MVSSRCSMLWNRRATVYPVFSSAEIQSRSLSEAQAWR